MTPGTDGRDPTPVEAATEHAAPVLQWQTIGELDAARFAQGWLVQSPRGLAYIPDELSGYITRAAIDALASTVHESWALTQDDLATLDPDELRGRIELIGTILGAALDAYELAGGEVH